MELWSADRVLVKGQFEKDWGLVVDDDGVVQAVGPRQHLVANARAVHHYSDKVLMPAFINPHHYGYQRLFRGFTPGDMPFLTFLKNKIWPLSRKIDTNLLDAVYRIAFAEQAMAGIGTVGEFHYLHNGAGKDPSRTQTAERLVRIATEMGIRLTLIYSFFDQGDRRSAGAFIQPLDASVKAFEGLRIRYENHPLVNIIPGIHSLEHTSPDAILAAANLAEKYDTRFHIKLAVRESELEVAKVHYGTTPLRALAKMEVLNERLVVAFGTMLDEEELALLRQHEVSVILCPTASMTRGENCPQTERLLANQVPFAVGSSSVCMSHHYSVPDEIKWLELTQRGLQKSNNVLCQQMDVDSLWELGTWLPAQMLGVNSARFMPGSSADFMLVSIAQPSSRPTFGGRLDHNYVNQLLFGWSAQVSVSHLMVQGKMIVKNGAMNIDLTSSYQYLEKHMDTILHADQGTFAGSN